MGAKIKYNGQEINMVSSGTKVAKTGGKFVPHDIEFEYVKDEGGGIVPSGSAEFRSNGTYDVTELAEAVVNVPTGTARSAADVTAIGASVNVPAGLYAEPVEKSIDAGSVTLNTPTVNDSGLVTASAAVTQGYISATPANKTLQLPTQAAQNITPGLSAQEIGSGKFLTGKQTIGAITKELLAQLSDGFRAENIKKDTDIFGLIGTMEEAGAVTVVRRSFTPQLSEYGYSSAEIDCGFLPDVLVVHRSNEIFNFSGYPVPSECMVAIPVFDMHDRGNLIAAFSWMDADTDGRFCIEAYVDNDSLFVDIYNYTEDGQSIPITDTLFYTAVKFGTVSNIVPQISTGTATAQNTSNATSIRFTGLPAEPKGWSIMADAQVSIGSTRTVCGLQCDGNKAYGDVMYRSSSNGTMYHSDAFTWNWSNGTLTVSAPASNTNWYFTSNVSYRLVYNF